MNSQHLRENNLINPTIYTNYDDIPAALLFQPPNHQTHGRRLESWEFLHQELHWRPEIWTCTKTFLGNKEKVISTELRSLRLGSEFTIKWTYGSHWQWTNRGTALDLKIITNKLKNLRSATDYILYTPKCLVLLNHWLISRQRCPSNVLPFVKMTTQWHHNSHCITNSRF